MQENYLLSSPSTSPLFGPNWHRVLTFTLSALSDTAAFPQWSRLLVGNHSFFFSFSVSKLPCYFHPCFIRVCLVPPRVDIVTRMRSFNMRKLPQRDEVWREGTRLQKDFTRASSAEVEVISPQLRFKMEESWLAALLKGPVIPPQPTR